MIDKLNERLTIEKSKAYTDKAGNHRNTWEDYFSCFTYASTYELQESGDEVKQVAITNAEAEAQKTAIKAEAQAEANKKIAEACPTP